MSLGMWSELLGLGTGPKAAVDRAWVAQAATGPEVYLSGHHSRYTGNPTWLSDPASEATDITWEY